MPTLRNTLTGAVISCSEGTAARLGGEWQPVGEEPAKAEKKAAPRRGRKTKAKTDSSDED